MLHAGGVQSHPLCASIRDPSYNIRASMALLTRVQALQKKPQPDRVAAFINLLAGCPVLAL